MLLSGAYLLGCQPTVVAIADNNLDKAISLIGTTRKRIHFFVFPMWYRNGMRAAARTLRDEYIARGHRVTWLCNADAEVKTLRRAGRKAWFCHQNLFCNESIFVAQAAPRKYDAIYTARLDAYKRIHLASQIKRLRIITANPEDKDRLSDWGCGHASMNDAYIDKSTIASDIASSGCGLALSAKEGGMFAATEYLLCGCPVVTTESLGGRDFWFNEENSVTIKSTCRAVAEAVGKFQARLVDRSAIRERTLELVQSQRRLLAEYLSDAGADLLPSELSSMNGDWLRGRFVFNRDLRNALLNHDS
ncbi:glycosyltransferase family 1 protein [Rhodopirellula sp. SWK7]|uniref:glycosyltransferase family 1 protein n=1 Tax=Rhodopirellula sp. SWK7 TaxID=595460 RepID=UPI0002BEB8E2|nr:glycosyltransferase family 1 protein [Rhodopirellula sp. SWK7]EMI44587.1 hypothetical protein RRSWK_02653 [Rhodopirellula sp. SWK7]